MALNVIKTNYPFLAHPPPQKKRPLHPLPPPPSRPSLPPTPTGTSRGPRRRSSTFSTIIAWAARVQPGSPASFSPRSPRGRTSLGKGRRRPSIASIHAPSVSFLHIGATPTTAHFTPSIGDFKPDLTAVGYTSVFLRLPDTPISTTLSLSIKPSSQEPAKNIPIPIPPIPSSPCKPRGLTRFRSLAVLRSRGESKSVSPDSPTRMKAKAAVASAAIVKRKKAKYAIRPPPLANELALMQFADGGDTDSNIKRIMEAQTKAAGAVGLADIYRDGEGGIWWDQDEQWEYAHLLAEGDQFRARASGDSHWVTFGSNTSPSAIDMPGDERRGSVSTQDSDLDPKYIVQPTDSLDGDDLALFGGAITPIAPRKPISVLSLPCRPRLAAKHLRKPDFLIDAAFSRPGASPKSQKSPTSSGVGHGAGMLKPKGKARRRPAPLKLSPPGPVFKLPTNSPTDADKVRKDFIAASFEPLIPRTPVTPATAVCATTPVDMHARLVGGGHAINVPWRIVNDGVTSWGTKRKPSMLNMMGLFRSARKEDVMC